MGSPTDGAVTRPTTILVLSDNLWISGPGRSTVTLCNLLSRYGCAVHLHGMLGLSGRFLTHLEPDIEATGDEDLGESIDELLGVVRRSQPDAILVNYSPAGLAFAVSKRIEGILTCPVGLFVRAPGLWEDMLSHPAVHGQIDRFLAVSTEIATWLLDDVGVPGDRISIARNLVDTEQFRPNPDARDASLVTALYLGRTSTEKRPSRIVEAYRRAASSAPRLRLTMVGGQDPAARGPTDEAARNVEDERRKLDEACRACAEEGIPEPWRVGATDDVVPWLQRSDVLVLASEFEGTPNVVNEAFACGLPVIVPAGAGDCAEMVRADSSHKTPRGLIYDGESIDDLIAKLTEFSRMLPQTRQAMGTAARAYAVENVSVQSCGEDYAEKLLTSIGVEAVRARRSHETGLGASRQGWTPDRSTGDGLGRFLAQSEGPVYVVTGGAGFIGGALVRYLVRSGASVVVSDDLSTGRIANLDALPRGSFYLVPDDISAAGYADQIAQAVAGQCSGIFHLAAMTSVPRSFDQPDRCHAVNIGGTMAVLEAAARLGVRVVMASSSSVYGLGPVPQREDQARIGEQLSPYAESKWAGDVAVRETGGVALRFFNVFGPRQRDDSPYTGVIALWSRGLLDGTPLTIYGDGLQSRAFVYVSDVVEALVAAMQSEKAAGRAFNVGASSPARLWDILTILSDQVDGASSPIEMKPARRGDIRHSHPDLTAPREILGWEPTTEIRRGLRTTLRWYRRGGAR